MMPAASLARTSLPSCRYLCGAAAVANSSGSCLPRPASAARLAGVRCNATVPPEFPGSRPPEMPDTAAPPELPSIDAPPEFNAPPGVDVPMPGTPVPEQPGPSIPSPPRPEIPTVPSNPDVPPPRPEVDPPRAPPEVAPPEQPDVVPPPSF